jgi:hypothetical protein
MKKLHKNLHGNFDEFYLKNCNPYKMDNSKSFKLEQWEYEN